ncbi:MAG: hypothetical protein AAGC53_23510 [Actinomycetota bacterium]
MLPTWTAAPADEGAAIAEIKEAICARIERSGRTVAEVFAVVEASIAEQVAEIRAANDVDGTAWPQVQFEAIASRGFTDDERALIRQRG